VTLDLARKVLTAEANAILRLADQLGEDFERAADMIVACEGRVVWSGMGKSGIIARKLAATMSSTGTPALFLHPAEAIHGDIGMVTRSDIVIAVSNSGATEARVRR
jgi:arabinose-5-phosphate isomerase